MTNGERPSELGSGGAWARFEEPHVRPCYNAVFERLKIARGIRLLDVGCGLGGAALLAAGRGVHVAGLDRAPNMIKVARERLPDGNFRVGHLQSLPWPEDSFDAVTGFNAFQFAREPIAALTEARRVLGHDGKAGMVTWAPREASQQPSVMAAISRLAPPQQAGHPEDSGLDQAW